LSAAEKNLVTDSVLKHGIKQILFIGGEPTLYIPDMQDIISRLDGADIEFRMTTNGHFAKSKDAASKVLSSIPRLAAVNLSCDRQHEKFLPEANIQNLFSACRELGIVFRVVLALSSPLDLVLLKKLREVGRFPIMPQKMLPMGAAKKNNLGYKHPSFDKRVLSRVCPNRKVLVYMCGQGFTVCCSSLAFNSKSGRVVHPTLVQHLSSDFYKLITKHTLGRVAEKLGVSDMKMLPEYSSPCVLCEQLFANKYGQGL
jgi:hypothetical protein